MTNKIKCDDLFNLAMQSYSDGHRCFLNGDGSKASFYAGELSAYITLLIEYFDKTENELLATIEKANQSINHSGF